METEKPRPAQSGSEAEDWTKLKAPERAEKMLELSKARQVVMAEHVAALKTFYALLTPKQQKIFEEQHAPVSYTHLRAHETVQDLVCRLLLEKQKTV